MDPASVYMYFRDPGIARWILSVYVCITEIRGWHDASYHLTMYCREPRIARWILSAYTVCIVEIREQHDESYQCIRGRVTLRFILAASVSRRGNGFEELELFPLQVT